MLKGTLSTIARKQSIFNSPPLISQRPIKIASRHHQDVSVPPCNDCSTKSALFFSLQKPLHSAVRVKSCL